MCEDFYAVLLDNTEGELHKKVVRAMQLAVSNGESDGGARSYLQVWAYFMESTGLKMSSRRAAWMTPQPVKHESEVANAVEAWEAEELELKRLEPHAQDIPDCYMMIALKCMLVGKMKDHIELNAWKLLTYDAMRSELMAYAALRRADDFPLIGKRTVNNVNPPEDNGGQQQSEEGYGNYGGHNWWDHQPPGYPTDEGGDANAVGKGGKKGNGNWKGQPNGKGYGKGKGGGKGR